MKREIKTFQQKLSVWDANYCIYGGRTLTDKIRHVRQEILEKKEDVWKGKKENISIKELDELYKGLTDIEGELKREMKIHFTESED